MFICTDIFLIKLSLNKCASDALSFRLGISIDVAISLLGSLSWIESYLLHTESQNFFSEILAAINLLKIDLQSSNYLTICSFGLLLPKNF